MDHLSRSKNYLTTLQAIKKDHPEVAEAMDRMADCVSAASEIVASQLNGECKGDPNIVVPVALEIFRDSRNTKKREVGIVGVEDNATTEED